MPPLPFVDLVARIIFYAAFAVFILTEARSLLRGRSGRTTALDRGTRLAVVGCIGGGFVVGFVLAGTVGAAAIRPARWPVFIVGIVLMLAGTAFRQWAITTLGRFFTTEVRIAEDQTVVTSGPYGLVRHPSYTGAIVTFLGIGLALGNWLALAVLLVLPLLGFVIRIRVEDEVLLSQLGEPYAEYAAARKRLVPGLW